MVTIDHAIKAWTEELVQEIPRFVQEKLDPLEPIREVAIHVE
jgi:hypothetical protein